MLLDYNKNSGWGGLIGTGIKDLKSIKSTSDYLTDVDSYGLDNLTSKNIYEMADAYDHINPKAIEYVQNVKSHHYLKGTIYLS